MDTPMPLRIFALLLFYGALFVIIVSFKKRIEKEERKTFFMIGVAWAVSVFIGNYLFYLLGIMSFLPWINNFMHTFLWIGICLSFLYLGIREDHSMIVQFIFFATFSLIVKYAEQMLFGIWELEHFFFIFKGNVAYVLGWSLLDGLYPPLTFFGLRLFSRWIPGLVAI
jgi:hypothetical protein